MQRITARIPDNELRAFLAICAGYEMTNSEALRGLIRLFVLADVCPDSLIEDLAGCEQRKGIALPLYIAHIYGKKRGGQQ